MAFRCPSCGGDIVFDISDGTHNRPQYLKSGVPFLSVKDISSGYLNFSDTKFVSQKTHDDLKKRCFPRYNDLLITKVGSNTGIPVIVDTNREFSIFVSVALVKYPQSLLIPRYLLNVIKSPLVQKQVKDNTRGVGNKNWVIADIKKTILPLPPLAEQERIVAKVNALLAEIEPLAEAEKELDQLEKEFPQKIKTSLLKAAIQGKLSEQLPTDGDAKDLLRDIQIERAKLIKQKKIKAAPLPPIKPDEIPFDIPENWQWVRLGDICEMYTGNSISEHEKQLKYCGRAEGFDFIATKDISFENNVDYDNGVKIPFENNFKRAEKNSVLMCIEGGSAGRKIAVVDREVCFGNKLCNFNAYQISNKYIYFYLQSPTFAQFFSQGIVGIIGGVGINKLKNILIPLPPLAEQKRIVARLEKLLAEIEI